MYSIIIINYNNCSANTLKSLPIIHFELQYNSKLKLNFELEVSIKTNCAYVF